MIGLICSSLDQASVTIFKQILKTGAWTSITENEWRLLEYNGDKLKVPIQLFMASIDTVFCENIESELSHKPELLVFATRHQSQSGIPCLTTHTPGNWSSADYGGKSKTVCVSPARITDAFFQTMREKVTELKQPLDVVFEATHHGPALHTPTCFIEIGSTQTQWQDERLGKIICDTLFDVLTSDLVQEKEWTKEAQVPAILGIGGLHTAPTFCSLAAKRKYIVGHICPHYQLEHLDIETVRQAMEKTVPVCNTIVVDIKGLKAHKEQVMSLLKKLENEYSIVYHKS